MDFTAFGDSVRAAHRARQPFVTIRATRGKPRGVVESPVTTARPIPVDLLQRMVDAVELVRQRLMRASQALQARGIAYAVVGGNAVAAWVATIDRAAVRNTQDVDV